MAATSATGTSPQAAKSDPISRQGKDTAVFYLSSDKVEVCDREKDGHKVYAILDLKGGDQDIIYDDTPGCTSDYVNEHEDYETMWVCEDGPGPDWPFWCGNDAVISGKSR